MLQRTVIIFFGGLLALLLTFPPKTGTVTVRCPGGPAATTYYYDLVGSGYLETISVDYIPGAPETSHATIGAVPMGSYRLLENGVERATVILTAERAHILVEPEAGWPIMPPRGKE